MLPLRIHILNNNRSAYYQDGKVVLLDDKILTVDFPFYRKFNTSWVVSSFAEYKSPVNYSEILSMINSNQIDYSGNIQCLRHPELLDAYKNATISPVTTVTKCYTLSCYKAAKDQKDEFFFFLSSFDQLATVCLVFLIVFFLLAYSSFSLKEVRRNFWAFYGFFFNGLELVPSKLAWKKVILLTFALFLTIFQTIALSFVKTSFLSPDKCEKIETVADMAKADVTLFLEKNDECGYFFRSLETRHGNRIKLRLRSPTTKENSELHSGQMYLAPNTVYIAHPRTQKKFVVEQYALPKARRFVGQMSTSPFHESQIINPLNKNTPKEVSKRLRQCLYRRFEQGISSEVADTSLKRNLYMLSKPPLSKQAIALPITYFKTVFAVFFLMVTLASIAFFLELFIFNYKQEK